MKFHSRAFLSIALPLGLAAFAGLAEAEASKLAKDWQSVYDHVRASLVSLYNADIQDANESPTTVGLAAYFDYYNFSRIPAQTRASGWLEVSLAPSPLRVSAHRFDPRLSEGQRPKGSLLLLHGYFDHSGNMVDLASRLCAQGYALLLCDLPGHGFSDGPFAAIDNFSSYGKTVAACVAYMQDRMPAPAFGIGHSTGASALMEYQFQGGEGLKALVFFGPLVRIRAWPWVKLGTGLAGVFGYAPSRGPSACRNPAYRELLSQDWLGRDRVSPAWMQALFSWNRGFSQAPRSDIPLLIFQGRDDRTVDWKWNIAAISARFPAARTVYLPQGGHLLPNELDQEVYDVVGEITSYLGEHTLEPSSFVP